jgi:hypothetical protein
VSRSSSIRVAAATRKSDRLCLRKVVFSKLNMVHPPEAG